MTAAVARVPASADGAQRQRPTGLDGIRGLAVPDLLHGPIAVIVYDEFVARRLHTRPGAILVTAALAVPLAIVMARILAAVFEIPFLSSRTRPRSAPHYSVLGRVLA